MNAMGKIFTFSLYMDSYKESAQEKHFCLRYASIHINSRLVHKILIPLILISCILSGERL